VKPGMMLALLLWQATPGSVSVTANPQYLRYQRAVTVAADRFFLMPLRRLRI
jgi:hypothetical protein